MLDMLPRLLAAAGAMASWISILVVAVVALFVIYIGVAMAAALLASDAKQQRIRLKILQSLLGILVRRQHK